MINAVELFESGVVVGMVVVVEEEVGVVVEEKVGVGVSEGMLSPTHTLERSLPMVFFSVGLDVVVDEDLGVVVEEEVGVVVEEEVGVVVEEEVGVSVNGGT